MVERRIEAGIKSDLAKDKGIDGWMDRQRNGWMERLMWRENTKVYKD